MEQARNQCMVCMAVPLPVASSDCRLGRYWDLSCYSTSSSIPERTSSDVRREPLCWMRLIDKELVMNFTLHHLLEKNMTGLIDACMTPNRNPQILLALRHTGPKSIVRTMCSAVVPKCVKLSPISINEFLGAGLQTRSAFTCKGVTSYA